MKDQLTVEPARRPVVRVHRQAMEMFRDVQRHLKQYPEDAILFALDYEKALGELGYRFSRGMQEHLKSRLPATNEQKQALYRRIKNGEAPPFDFRIQFSGLSEETESPPTTPAHLAFAPKPPAANAIKPTGRVSLVPEMNALAGSPDFSVVIQITETFLNSAVGAVYDTGLLPGKFAGTQTITSDSLKIAVDVGYNIDIDKPTISLNTPYDDGIAFNLAIHGTAEADVDILQFISPTHSDYRQQLNVSFSAQATLVATVRIAPVANQESAVYADFRSIRDLNITINDTALSPSLDVFLAVLLERILLTKLGDVGQVPLTFQFNNFQRSGIAIKKIFSRILPPLGTSPACLAIAFDTFGDCVVTSITNLVPSGAGFAFTTSRRFLLNQVWPQVLLPQIPTEDNGVQIKNPSLDMQNGYLFVSVDFEKDIDCLPSITGTASAKLAFSVTKGTDGIYRGSLITLGNPDIEISVWDQIFYGILVGILGNAIVPGSFSIFAVLTVVLIQVFQDVLGGDASNVIDSFSIGFKQTIPGTHIIAEASTPQAPQIATNQIFAYGDAAFYPQA